MGYRTTYCLVNLKKEDRQQIVAWISKRQVAHPDFCYALGSEGKWYEYKDDMLEVSRAFPGILITLHGQGEEWDDIWQQYFLNGKTYQETAKIKIEFDELQSDQLK